jgi:hypothetical protein
MLLAAAGGDDAMEDIAAAGAGAGAGAGAAAGASDDAEDGVERVYLGDAQLLTSLGVDQFQPRVIKDFELFLNVVEFCVWVSALSFSFFLLPPPPPLSLSLSY